MLSKMQLGDKAYHDKLTEAPTMIGLLTTKTIAVLAKLTPLAKGFTVFGVLLFTAVETGFPIRDPWFDLVCLMALASIVGGEPEPDLKLNFREFIYLWFYRSSHLMLSVATAYFLHKNKWESISGMPDKLEKQNQSTRQDQDYERTQK